SLEDLDLGESATDLLIVGVSSADAKPEELSEMARDAACPVLFLVSSPYIAAAAPKRAGVDYLVKPFNPYGLREKVDALLATRQPAEREASAVLAPRALRYLEPPFATEEVARQARKFAETPFPVLISAEAGCGQEAVARAVHALANLSGAWLAVHASEAAQLPARVAALPSGQADAPPTLYIRDVDAMDLAAQSALLDFLLAEETRGRELKLIANARGDLLEKVYRGEFLDALYYRLATLVISMPPLRDRPADIPLIAERLAEECSQRLGVKKPRFSAAALERLRNYLWFGNLDEMESVIARTLAAHAKELIDAPDLALGERPAQRSERAAHETARPHAAAPAPAEAPKPQPAVSAPVHPARPEADAFLVQTTAPSDKPREVSVLNNGHAQELKILIGELAHELKNPMVTVKTFSQLLGDRFDDPAFRVRFQQTVNGDIQRMDDLLESLIAFSHFGAPEKEKVLVYEQLRRVEEELLPDLIKRESALQWGQRSEAVAALVDKAQFVFAFKNILAAVVGQVKAKSEIQVDIDERGGVGIRYAREAPGVGALAEYVGAAVPAQGEEALPLRVLLANILLERNGGAVTIKHFDGQKSLVSAQLPTEHARGYELKP
ncbi:MAG TPA: sigma 54-interacting transcriptional regulator, partial [Candidatus Binatia bacterium]